MRCTTILLSSLLFFISITLSGNTYGQYSSEYPQRGLWGEKIISPGIMYDYALSPDGKYLATSGSLGAYIWDMDTARIIRTLEGHDYIITSIDFTPDSKRILTSSWDKTIKLWNVETGDLIRTYKNSSYFISNVAALPNSTSFLSGDDNGTIWHIEIDTGNIINTYHLGKKTNEIIPDPGGEFFYALSSDGRLFRYYLTHNSETSIRIHNGVITSISISNDGKTAVTSSWDETIKLWDTETLSVIRTFPDWLDDYESKYYGETALSPDANFVITTSRAGTLLWDCNTGTILKNYGKQKLFFYRARFTPDGNTFILAANNTIYLYDTKTAELQNTFLGHNTYPNSFQLTPDDKHLVLSEHSSNPKLIETQQAKTLLELNGHEDIATVHAITPNGKYALSTGGYHDRTIRIWDLFTGKILKLYNHETSSLRFLSVSPNGVRAISKEREIDDPIKIWDLWTGNTIFETVAYSALFLPDGKTLLTGQENGDFLWNLETGQKIKTFTNMKGTNYQSQFINDHLFLQKNIDNSVSLWDIQLDQKVKEFDISNSYRFDYNKKKNILAQLNQNPKIIIQDFYSDRILGILPGHWHSISNVQFSSDGTKVFSAGSNDATVREWDISALVKNRSETPVETPLPNDQEYSWLVLDGFGGIHSSDDSIQVPELPYFYLFNIVRDIEPDPMGEGWYMLDGYGGIHSSPNDLPKPANLPYLPGLDFARNLEIKVIDGKRYFYLLDFYGVIFSDDPNFERGNLPWFGEDRARDLEPSPYDDGWMVLDDRGNVYFSHQQWQELPVNQEQSHIKAMTRFPNETSVLIDGFGGIFTNPKFPAHDVIDGLPENLYFHGFDIIWDVEAIPKNIMQ